MSEWQKMRVGDVASITHGFAFAGEFFTDEDNGVVLVTPGNFAIGGGFQEKSNKYFAGECPKEYVLNPGDLIVTMTDLSKGIDTLGYAALVPNSGRKYLHNQRIGRVIISDDTAIDKGFLCRVLQTYSYQRTIAGSSSGSTVHHTSPAKIMDYKFRAPALDEQRKIAGVLAAYDKPIENNRKQIALLEEAAQRLYKEWFIDLRFPGHETTPIHDGLPEGWHCSTLGAEVTAVRGTSYSSDQLVDEGANSLVNLGNIQPFGGYRVGREKSFAGTGKPEQQVGFGDVIIGLTEQAAGLAGYAALVPTIDCKALISADLARLIPYVPGSEFYLYCSLRYGGLSRQLSPFASGTKIKHLKPADLALVGYVRPDELLLKKFCSVVKPLFSAIDILRQQSAAAREARDRLLPRLMSGEIEV